MVAASLVFAAASAVAASQDYAAYVEKARNEWGVPGVAIAVVKDGKVVMARGFGVRELGRPEPVGPDTLFAVGSLSKGFTAAAIGTLVSEGKLAWDDKVTDLLPGFAVADPWVTREITLRDLLAHRTGWQPQVDFFWYAGYPPSEVIARLAHANESDPFRGAYTYLNTPYLVAAEAAARRAGVPWDRLLTERVIEPLGLRRTFATHARSRGIEDVAAFHTETDGKARVVPPQSGDEVAPAAAVRSTASDMARWVMAQIDGGTLDGKSLYGAGVAREMHTPQNLIPMDDLFRRLWPESHFEAYTLGWVTRDYRGRKVVWNTGGLLGASCTVAFVPEDRLGVVVLTNGPRTSFPEALAWRALDTWLGAPAKDWAALRLEISLASRKRAAEATARAEARAARDREAGARPSLDDGGYAGTYRMPLLGDLVVTLDGARLRARLGALVGTLEPWRRDTFRARWDVEVYGTDLISFRLGPDGRTASAEFEGAGTFERVADSPAP